MREDIHKDSSPLSEIAEFLEGVKEFMGTRT